LNSSNDLDALLSKIGDSKYVLLGEASHGTSEFYKWRANITRRLISEKGFNFVAVEGDWPDCFEINKYVKNQRASKVRAIDVLTCSFNRWPTWMWANWEIAELMDWMKTRNEGLSYEKKAGFYGLDVYSLYESLQCMVNFAEKTKDSDAMEAVEDVLDCFQSYARDPIKYGRSVDTKKGFSDGCKKEVLSLLLKMNEKYKSKMTKPYQKTSNLNISQEEIFSAQMNSKVLVDAENYYRIMIKSSSESWNVRDDHMADTLDSLMGFHGPEAKCIVWAHNTHVGDARFTDMVDDGERNLGQIVRESHKNDGVFIVGFGTNEGSVIAGDHWDAPFATKLVPEAAPKSWEHLFNLARGEEIPDKMMIFSDLATEDRKLFDDTRGNRAIGVVYNPMMDRFGHWVPTVLGRRYDAFIYLDKTKALHPLPAVADLSLQPPQTYPWGEFV